MGNKAKRKEKARLEKRVKGFETSAKTKSGIRKPGSLSGRK